jgi:uncharacterized protein YgiM (DUF1202 family)
MARTVGSVKAKKSTVAKTNAAKVAKKLTTKKSINIISEEETSSDSDVDNTAKKTKAVTQKRKRTEEDDEDTLKKKNKTKSDEPVKHEAIMVIYKIDESMPELQASHNNKAGSILLSDLYENNSSVTRNDVSSS